MVPEVSETHFPPHLLLVNVCSYVFGFLIGDQFYLFLHYYLQAIPTSQCPIAGKALYSRAIKFDPQNPNIIRASYFHTPLRSPQDYLKAWREAKRLSYRIEDANRNLNMVTMNVSPYSVFYPFLEQDRTLMKTTILLLAIVLGKFP
jgi:Niemann-Pick C1 protein